MKILRDKPSRRQFLDLCARGFSFGALTLAGAPLARAQNAGSHRLLHVFLKGGWDSALATDPVTSAKQAGAQYDSQYASLGLHSIPGKPQLVFGYGLEPLLPALSSVPVAIVNGLLSEVTAHELAQAYMYSGVLSLTRSREFPALSALIGQNSGEFPPHLVLGSPIPLGESKWSSPPLLATSGAGLADMLRGPYNQWVKKQSFGPAHGLIEGLDLLRHGQLTDAARTQWQSWQTSGKKIAELYEKELGQKLTLTDAIKSRYQISQDWSWQTLLPSAYLSFRHNLCSLITVSIDGFDTHSNHYSQHVPLMRQVAQALRLFLEDLSQTPDPLAPGSSLLDHTTILINSEFVRTPRLNAGSGTDHHPSASALVLGKGIRDGVIIGQTDLNAKPMGWNGSGPVPLTETNAIRPELLTASLLKLFGQHEKAQSIGGGLSLDILA